MPVYTQQNVIHFIFIILVRKFLHSISFLFSIMVFLCGGWTHRNLQCTYAPDGSGERARTNSSGVCFLCNPDYLFQAMTSVTGRGNVVRKLKLLRTNSLEVYHRAWSESTLTLLGPHSTRSFTK